MHKKIKVGFREQSKAVVAECSIEYIVDEEVTETHINDKALQETEALMNKAMQYATTHTMRKSR